MLKFKFLLFKNLPILLILILSLPAVFYLLTPGYFSMHDDIQVMRIFEMQKCLKDLQIPCRWVPDMGAGYGHPLFNFHPVLPYYFGVLFRVVNISIVDSVKYLFLISLVGSAIGMYFLTKEFFGKIAGIVSAVAILYAPYRAVQVYVRGAMNETWALMFIPVILLSLYKFTVEKKWFWFVFSIISISFLMLSHNLMVVVFLPFILIWSVFWAIFSKNINQLKWLFLIFFWGAALSSFFVIPSYFERDLAKIDFMTTGYYIYKDHFIDFNQLFFSRKFGYGPSIEGGNDDLSFQVGWPHFFIVIVSLILLVINKRIINRQTLFGWFSIGLFLLGVFMSTIFSKGIWDVISFLKYLQFPWRYLTLIIFAEAILTGFLVFQFKGFKKRLIISMIIISSFILLNFSYFKPQIHYPYTNDSDLLDNQDKFIKQSVATLGDYVPASVKYIPSDFAPVSPFSDNSPVEFKNFAKSSNKWSVVVENKTGARAKVFIPIFDFPEWDVKANGKKIHIGHEHNNGLITFFLEPGTYKIEGVLRNTPIRNIANGISLISFLALIGFIAVKVYRRN